MSADHGHGHGESHGHSASSGPGWMSHFPKSIVSIMSGVFSGIMGIFSMPFGGGGGGSHAHQGGH